MTDAKSQPSERFVLLDGLRGIAAVFIIQRHAEDLLGDALPSSYLGVDLFFALSGFVLAHAYGAALAEGRISTSRFLKARLLRLYPLYGIALALGTAYYIHMYFAGLPVMADEYVIPQELVLAFFTGLLFLPSPVTISFNAALFIVHPAWSLFNELVANVAYAWRGARATVRQIGVLLAVSAVLLVVAALQFDRLHAGFRWHEMYAGMARVFFSFFVGVLIYRYRRKVPLVRPLQSLACLALLALVLVFPTPRDLRWIFDLAVVFLVWPALLYWASAIVPGPRTSAVASFLGTASYGVYVLHTPLLDWAHVLWPGVTDAAIAPYAGIGLIILVVLISWYATIRIDQPLQKRLKQRVLKRVPVTP
ncbi:Peptidoglycan/LPS O-acetylase OafA/YrhL, contains acyltransferase and SGNH-hydrolase domains [Rhizobium sp. NFR07]|uniref:acyltransferase family protein n=1 Tax=Rhizobium sp. NFR07 TaxID=1566262 RepID=UPI0008E25FE5|nr:acyltransferase [Rhizobium sp. NFR07]SFB42180.1 Peptidoglycan/LPS O-acetylase OafA/YrhL, contains acyltransferase and SGNH-hydrolase domains [Rhizobium sp. NFR07]